MFQHTHTSPEKPDRVVILGGSGFIGRYLVRRFETQGVIVVSISSKQIDLSDGSALEKLSQSVRPNDAVIFASCITREKGGDDLPTFMKNLRMAENVGMFLETRGCAHLVYFSSDAVYKDGISLVREETEKDPEGLYAMTQLTREKMITYSARKSNVPLLIVRPSAVYGHGDTHNGYGPNRFLKTAQVEGKITLFGEGEEKRDHIYVGDVCELVELCVFNRSIGVLNLATGKAISFMEVAKKAIETVKKPVQLDCLPRKSPITHKVFDNTALLKAFPSFRFVSIKEGLIETINQAN